MDSIDQSFEKIKQQSALDKVKVELLISSGDHLKIGFQKKQMNSFESTVSQIAGVRVVSGGSQGYAYTENLSEESLLRTYREALFNARTVQVESGVDIPLQSPVAIPSMSSLSFIESVPMEQKIEMARLLEEKCLVADGRVQGVPYSGFQEARGTKRVMNSEGLDVQYDSGFYVCYAYPTVKDGESSKMDGEATFSRKFHEIQIDQLTSVGVEKALSRLHAKQLPTGHYPVVLGRDQFAVVLEMLSDNFSAKEVFEGKSLLRGKVGQKVASEKLQLLDDPFVATGVGSRPFDDEGVPSQKISLIQNGVLQSYLTNLEYAQKMNLPVTGHASRSPTTSLAVAPSNLVVAKGDESLEDLLSRYPKVLYVTEFSGGAHAGYKASTGDISMPVEGFLYENGKRVGPFDQMILSGNILDLLQNIEALGNTYNKAGQSIMCPDVLIKDMSFAGA